MPRFLIVRLSGVLQAWGSHTYEDVRPSELFPTRSGLTGLFGACLGIDRNDAEGLAALSSSFVYAARSDAHATSDGAPMRGRKLTDYHTVEAARRVSGKPGDNPVQSWREYLCDTRFTVAAEFVDGAAFSLERVAAALERPHYTPVLGRRSCPPSEPLLHSIVDAPDMHAALDSVEPGKGTVYSEIASDGATARSIRDVSAAGRARQFVTRTVYVLGEEVADVSQ